MQRYDRQIRLWSVSGQESLRSAHVLAVGISAAVAEALKNLCLAGVGQITIIEESDAPPEGFVAISPGSFTDQLRAMNGSVLLKRVPTAKDMFAQKDFLSVDVILLGAHAELDASVFVNVPRLVVGSRFLKGTVILDTRGKELTVMQAHPAAGLSDLRFGSQVWPGYREFCDSFDLSALPDMEHGQVPFGVLLVKAVDADADNVRGELESMRRSHEEQNVMEALKNAWRTRAELVPPGVRDLISYRRERVHDSEHPFWLLVEALETFVDKHGALPVSGEIPDMSASTENYLQLQKLYRAKARRDADELRAYLTEPVNEIMLDVFCKNSRYIQALVPNKKYEPPQVDPEFEKLPLCELTPVASLIGGIASQEAVKIILQQYTPMYSKLVYDGESQTTEITRESLKLLN